MATSILIKHTRSETDLVDRSDVERIIQVLESQPQLYRSDPRGLLTAKDACDLSTKSAADLINMVVSGHLRATARLKGIVGFNGLLFDRSHLIDTVAVCTGRAPAGFACQFFGISQLDGQRLRKAGYLDGGARKNDIDLAELREFLANHVTLDEIRLWDGAPRQKYVLRDTLRKAGVSPAIPEGSGWSRFWPRDAAERAIQNLAG